MVCEAKTNPGTVVVDMQEVKPVPVFNEKDPGFGGENPFRAHIEDWKREITKNPTFFHYWGNV